MKRQYQCEICGRMAEQPEAWYKRNKHHTCSKECAVKVKRSPPRARPEAKRRINIVCDCCGKVFERISCKVRDGANYCSAACCVAARTGAKRGPTDRGVASVGSSYIHRGYVTVKVDADPAVGNGYMAEHRLTMERMIGRRLSRSECVHHINGDKTDNRPENLCLMGIGEHNSEHWKHRQLCANGCGRHVRKSHVTGKTNPICIECRRK